jgi:chaperone modulatory protein CbpM
MSNEHLSLLSGEVLEDNVELTLVELCHACRLPAESIHELIEEGVIEPVGRNPTGWRFHSICVRRVRLVVRLQRDLGVNLAGAALVLELMSELELLRARDRRNTPL